MPRQPVAVAHDYGVSDRIVVATEVLADGSLTRRDLNRSYTKLHRNVYVRKGVELTPRDRARAAWLWSDRKATLVGHSAAAVLGSKWIPEHAPVEVLHSRRPPPNGITVRSYELRPAEVCTIDAMASTTAARTAYDLGRRLPLHTAVIRIDALLNATSVTPQSVSGLIEFHPGARGIRRLQNVMSFVDAGAESPQETRLRLLFVQSELPRPVTQIPVANSQGRIVRRIDMGWPQWMVGAEYDGEQHWADPENHANDIDRLEFLAAKGWSIVRVSARQLRYQQPRVVQRVRQALRARGLR